MTIKELLAARTAPGTWHSWDRGIGWEVHFREPTEKHGYCPNLTDGFRDTLDEADARAIVAMDHIIDPALAVVEAARKYQCFGSCDEAECPDAALNNALVAFDAAVEEATR